MVALLIVNLDVGGKQRLSLEEQRESARRYAAKHFLNLKPSKIVRKVDEEEENDDDDDDNDDDNDDDDDAVIVNVKNPWTKFRLWLVLAIVVVVVGWTLGDIILTE